MDINNKNSIDAIKIKDATRCLKTLAHEFRLIVMCALAEGDKNVQQLMGITGASQSNLSQHLAKMRDIGLLDFHREANQIYYKIADRKVLQIIDAVKKIYFQPKKDTK